MAKKKNRKQKKNLRKTVDFTNAAFNPHDWEGANAAIQQKEQEGKSKAAVEMAKKVHDAFGTSQSEKLLVETYLHRIQRLIRTDLLTEADSLRKMVAQRYPEGWRSSFDLRTKVMIETGAADFILDELVRSDRDDRIEHRIHDLLRGHLTNPELLAKSAVLPSDHPLKESARAVSEAFTAVTSGPVEDAVIQLDAISRRNPLAPWKLLVRAIAQFYRHEDAACLDTLNRLEAIESIPGRFVPIMRGLLAGELPASATRDAVELENKVKGATTRLRKLFSVIDRLVVAYQDSDDLDDDDVYFDDDEEDTHEEYCDRVIEALQICKAEAPQLYHELKRRIIAQAYVHGHLDTRFMVLIHSSTPRDAQYWYKIVNHYAKEAFEAPNPTFALHWRFYQRHALKEKVFTPESRENRDVLLQVARISKNVILRYGQGDPEDNITRLMHAVARDNEVRDELSQIPEGQWEQLLDQPHVFYREAMAIEPDAGVFEEWFQWSHENEKDMEQEILEAWRQSFPEDSKPLIFLAQAAEGRRAFNKALKFIERAEALNPLATEVQNERFRFSLAIFKRHLEQKKPHLLKKDIAEIESLRMLEQGDAAIVPILLRWIHTVLVGDSDIEAQMHGEIVRLIGEPTAAYSLIDSVLSEWKTGNTIRKRSATHRQVDGKQSVPEGMLRGFGRAATLYGMLDLATKRFGQVLKTHLPRLRKAAPFPSEDLVALGQAFFYAPLHDEIEDALFWLSSELIADDGPYVTQALMMRGISFAYNDAWRAYNCLGAASYYARSRGDTENVTKVSTLWKRVHCWRYSAVEYDDAKLLFMDGEHAERTVNCERSIKRMNTSPRGYEEESHYIRGCPCSYCKHNREIAKRMRRFRFPWEEQPDWWTNSPSSPKSQKASKPKPRPQDEDDDIPIPIQDDLF